MPESESEGTSTQEVGRVTASKSRKTQVGHGISSRSAKSTKPETDAFRRYTKSEIDASKRSDVECDVALKSEGDTVSRCWKPATKPGRRLPRSLSSRPSSIVSLKRQHNKPGISRVATSARLKKEKKTRGLVKEEEEEHVFSLQTNGYCVIMLRI
jgi:hypothetical protein